LEGIKNKENSIKPKKNLNLLVVAEEEREGGERG
jgi:hypothetical protein